jgi:hypothetical protein
MLYHLSKEIMICLATVLLTKQLSKSKQGFLRKWNGIIVLKDSSEIERSFPWSWFYEDPFNPGCSVWTEYSYSPFPARISYSKNIMALFIV